MTLHTASIMTLQERGVNRVFMATVIAVVCRNFNSSARDIKGPWRDPTTVRARLAYYYLCRKYTVKSCTEIARKIGRFDHSVVVKGIKSLEKKQTRFEPELSRCIAALEGRE